MLKVFLVDDEIFTIHMLQTLIHWKEMGLELIGYAQNGEEAYKKVISDKPDIIISDIKMPGMNGIEFLKKVHVSYPEIRTILMSAYSDFSYVKEGMKLGANDYILKPIDELELEQALRKTTAEIQGEEEQKKIISQSVTQLNQLNLFRYIKTGKGINKVLTSEEFSWLNKGAFCMYRVQINNTTIAEYSNSENIGLSQEGYISRVLKSIVSQWSEKCMILDFEDDCWLIILNTTGDIEKGEAAEEILNEIKERTGIHVNIYFGAEGKKIEDLPVLFEDICNLSKYSFYAGEKNILGYGYNCNKKELDEIRNIGEINELKEAVSKQNVKKIQAILVRTFDMARKEKCLIDREHIYRWCYQVIQLVRGKVVEERKNSEVNRELMGMTYEKIKTYSSLEKLEEEVIALIKNVFDSVEKKAEGIKYSRPVQESLSIINDSYNTNLSLEDICQKVSVSKNYFCYLFKRETGMSIWNYLTFVRLQHARELLETTNLRSYEIAFKVGYENPSYFSAIFKKYESMSPNEYREQWRNIQT